MIKRIIKAWQNDWTFTLNTDWCEQMKNFGGGKTIEHCPVNIFSAIGSVLFWGLESSFRSLGLTDHRAPMGCKMETKSAAKILRSTIMDRKRKVALVLSIMEAVDDEEPKNIVEKRGNG